MKIKPLYVGTGILVVILGWYSYLAWCASKDLVTLNVRNMDVRKVLKKMERQTWETITPHKELQGKVTLRVNKVPLTEVLNIIGEQTSSRWTAMYPLYTKSKSLDTFKKAIIGEVEPEKSGWTNLQSRGMFGGGRGGFGGFGGFGGPGGGFGDMVRGQNDLVSLQVKAKDLQVATMAMTRFGQSQIVPEDGAGGIVTLSLHNVKFDKAVAQLAKRVKCKWDKIYSVRGFVDRGEGPPDMFADRGEFRGRRGRDRDEGPGERGPRIEQPAATNAVSDTNIMVAVTNAPPTNSWAQAREARRQQFEQVQQVIQDSMTPEQRQQMEQMRANPEAFRAQFQGMFERRGAQRLKNTTPEQRVERDRMRIERQRQREQRQQQGQRQGR